MSERIKGRSKHIVEGTVKEIKKGEKIEDYRRIDEKRNIFSRFISFIKREKR